MHSLDYQGLGVAKINGKTWFIENALPNEQVLIHVIEEKRQYGRAKANKILQASPLRQQPSCISYPQCGGCQMQHIKLDVQRQTKQQAFFKQLQRLQTEPIDWQPMISGQDKHYRRRTKLSMAIQHNQLMIGFRQQNTHQIIPLTDCEVLEQPLSTLLPKLQHLFAGWKMKKALGHIELVNADNTRAMLVRHIGKINAQDQQMLLNFAKTEQLSLYLMCDENHIEHLCGEAPYYQINGLTLHFCIRDFIQVNQPLNQKMVNKALEWLAITAEDRILDLFCGIGNFSLPIAQQAGFVVGVEGVEEMVKQAKINQQTSGLNNIAFYQTNLAESFVDQHWATQPFNKVLLDPARHGALFCLDHLMALTPERIIYISCNPATLVRDAEKLIRHGYKIAKSAVIDMFPHTGHLETVALLSKLDVDKHIDVEIKLDELDLTSAESKATYAQIKQYILEKFDLKVSTLYIAQIKKKCGIALREHYNKSKKEKQVIPQCTPEKEEAIMDALRHFKMI
nr:23S rRNA (uracil(1939)-C(5))-methyltransferase RlmD [[Haemophilus] ducreyi]